MMRAIQLAVVCVVVLVARQVQADIIITYQDVGSDLQFDYSGTLNTTAVPNLTLTAATVSLNDPGPPLDDPVFFSIPVEYGIADNELNPTHTPGFFATNLPLFNLIDGTSSGTAFAFRIEGLDPGPANVITLWGDWGAANAPINGRLILTGQSAAGIGMVDGWSVDADWGSITFQAAIVPEPTSMALVGIGAAGFGYFHRRRQKKLKLKQAA